MNRIVRNQIPLLWGLAAAIVFFVIDNYLDHLMLRITSANDQYVITCSALRTWWFISAMRCTRASACNWRWR